MDINKLRIIISTILKDKGVKDLTISEFNALLSAVNLRYLNKVSGIQQNPDAIVRSLLHKTNVPMSLEKLIVTYDGETTPLIRTVSGRYKLPDNCYYPYMPLHHFYNGISYPARFVDNQNWGEYIGSSLTAPTKFYPAFKIEGGYIYAQPINVTYWKYSYIRYPVTPVYATFIVQGCMEYDSVHSVQFEYPIQDYDQLIMTTMEYLGIVFGSGETKKYTENANS